MERVVNLETGRTSRGGAPRVVALNVLWATALVLVGCSLKPVEVPPEPYTVSEAASTYLTTICPVNAAWDATDLLIDEMRSALVVQPDDLEARHEQLSAALRELGDTSERAADDLDASLASMPGKTREALKRVAETLRADAAQARSVAENEAREIVDHEWAGVNENVQAAQDARELLGLTDAGAPSCD